MKEYLEFKKARCKDCYKCLRECPVKAIEVKNHQAQIIKERCILCGRCTVVCPQNAKIVHSEKDEVDSLLLDNDKVVASVAPSFISSFRLKNFAQMETVLYKLGFAYAEETAVGANDDRPCEDTPAAFSRMQGGFHRAVYSEEARSP